MTKNKSNPNHFISIESLAYLLDSSVSTTIYLVERLYSDYIHFVDKDLVLDIAILDYLHKKMQEGLLERLCTVARMIKDRADIQAKRVYLDDVSKHILTFDLYETRMDEYKKGLK